MHHSKLSLLAVALDLASPANGSFLVPIGDAVCHFLQADVAHNLEHWFSTPEFAAPRPIQMRMVEPFILGRSLVVRCPPSQGAKTACCMSIAALATRGALVQPAHVLMIPSRNNLTTDPFNPCRIINGMTQTYCETRQLRPFAGVLPAEVRSYFPDVIVAESTSVAHTLHFADARSSILESVRILVVDCSVATSEPRDLSSLISVFKQITEAKCQMQVVLYGEDIATLQQFENVAQLVASTSFYHVTLPHQV